jgi:hypothetical protein
MTSAAFPEFDIHEARNDETSYTGLQEAQR